MGHQNRDHPDFLVRLTNGVYPLLEVNGLEDDQDRAKIQAARRWVDAVNAWDEMGRWAFDLCERKEDPATVLVRHASP